MHEYQVKAKTRRSSKVKQVSSFSQALNSAKSLNENRGGELCSQEEDIVETFRG